MGQTQMLQLYSRQNIYSLKRVYLLRGLLTTTLQTVSSQSDRLLFVSQLAHKWSTTASLFTRNFPQCHSHLPTQVDFQSSGEEDLESP